MVGTGDGSSVAAAPGPSGIRLPAARPATLSSGSTMTSRRSLTLSLCLAFFSSAAVADTLRDSGYGDDSLIDASGYTYFPQPDGSYADAYGNVYSPGASGAYTDALGNVLSMPDDPAFSDREPGRAGTRGDGVGRRAARSDPTYPTPSYTDDADAPPAVMSAQDADRDAGTPPWGRGTSDRPGAAITAKPQEGMYLEDAGTPYLETEPVAVQPVAPRQGESGRTGADADAQPNGARRSARSEPIEILTEQSASDSAPSQEALFRDRIHLDPIDGQGQTTRLKPFPRATRD